MISTKTPPFIHCQVPKKNWQLQKADHEQRISELIDDYLRKRSHHQKDPVMDFLFEYYAFRPAHLKSWSPGFGTLLLQGTSQSWRFNEMNAVNADTFLDIAEFSADRISSLKWILQVLRASAERPPSFGCFGMHEWAMVYKSNNIRHRDLSLRMNPKELAEFVESRPLVCTHFDAFRFFTKEAKPRNKFELRRDTFAEKEQPGCLHTNMDLYKWAFKMYPWISSEIIRRAFELAVQTRMTDMKASPYDLRAYGLEPIKIETGEGQKEYLARQRTIFKRSQPIRKALIEEYERMLEASTTLSKLSDNS